MDFGSALRQIGMYFACKYVDQAEEKGYHRTALNLRKQGVPFEVAYLILFGCPPRV